MNRTGVNLYVAFSEDKGKSLKDLKTHLKKYDHNVTIHLNDQDKGKYITTYMNSISSCEDRLICILPEAQSDNNHILHVNLLSNRERGGAIMILFKKDTEITVEFEYNCLVCGFNEVMNHEILVQRDIEDVEDLVNYLETCLFSCTNCDEQDASFEVQEILNHFSR